MHFSFSLYGTILHLLTMNVRVTGKQFISFFSKIKEVLISQDIYLKCPRSRSISSIILLIFGPPPFSLSPCQVVRMTFVSETRCFSLSASHLPRGDHSTKTHQSFQVQDQFLCSAHPGTEGPQYRSET